MHLSGVLARTSGAGASLSATAERLALRLLLLRIGAEVTDSNDTRSAVRTPRGLNAAGRRLWDAGTSEFEWAQHELAMLEEACRTRDRIVELDAAVKAGGLMIASPQGSRVHPGVGEARQQRLTLARLLATLGIPPLEDDNLPAARKVRGVYGMR